MGLGLRRLARLTFALALLGALLGTLPAPAVSAATTYTVNALTDTGAGSGTTGDLRYAITQVNAGGGTGDTINITVTGTILLGSTLPTLAKPVTISGPGANLLAIDGGCTTCDPGGAFTGGVRVFMVGPVAATIGGVTIRHGNAGGGGTGGAIDNRSGGTLTLRDDTIARNYGYLGGGIFVNASSTLIVDRTTFEGNSASYGGSINNNNSGTLTVTNSTFANNQAQVGGAIINYNNNNNQASIAATTIGGNGASSLGGGIYNGGRLTLAGSIVAGNSAPAGDGPDMTPGSLVTDGGYNVIGSPDGNAFVDGTNHDLVGTAGAPLDPKLGPLASNGGPTQTFALLAGSPAIDTIPSGTLGCGTTLAVDQRGVARPQPAGGACDTGSFEAAATYTTTVNSAADGAANVANCLSGNGGTCRLRDAITVVDQGFVPASPTITFAQDTTVILDASAGTLTLSANLAIDGTGHSVTIDGGCTANCGTRTATGGVTVFTVNSAITADLTALAIRNGKGTSGGNQGGGLYDVGGDVTVTNVRFVSNASDRGGAIYQRGGTLTVAASTLTGNFGRAAGGGISNNGGTLIVTGSTFAANATDLASGGGGGIDLYGGALSASGTVTNSTFVGNSAQHGGGLVGFSAPLTVTNSTISGNSASDGAGLYKSGSLATLTNTVLANATATIKNCTGGGTLTADSHNLADDNTCGGATQATTAQLALGTLGDYGGPTQTIPLLPGSPAIDAGAAVGSGPAGATVPAADQRGKPRVGAPDIGAFESQGFTLTKGGGDGQSALVGTAFPAPLAVAVAANNLVEPVQGGAVTFTPPASGASAAVAANPATIGVGGAASATATANLFAGTYTVTASASGAATDATFNLTNTAPTIAIAPTTLPNGAAEQPYSTQLMASGTGSTAPFTFAVTAGALPTGLTLDPTTGLLAGTPTVAGSFPFTVTATDANHFTGTQGYTLVLTAPTVVIAPTNLPGGVKGIAYPPQTITASGGAVPYTFAVTTGTLPTGLTLTSTGILSGTPTATGTSTFTVTATDANGFAGTQQYTIGVTAAPLVSIAVTPNPAAIKVGQVQQLTATGTYADSSTADVTGQVTWTSDAPNAATVDTSGKVTGKAAGSAHITATQGTVSGQATATVTPPVLTGVQPAPAPASRPGGASVPGTPALIPSGSPTSGGNAPVAAPTGR